MERYSEYKDSGVQWLGQIPGHWKTIRVKSLLSERVDKSDTGTEEPLSMSQKYGIIPTKDMDVVPNMASTYVGAKKVFKNDLVFNKLKAHLGVFAISKYDGLVSPDYAVYTPNERTYLPFMEYMFHTPLYIGEFTRKATGVAIGLTRLYTNGLFAIPFLYPPLEEQQAIVSYLDDKSAKIDKMLEGKQKQIELLAEMKQRIIADAVTRGLNPNVKMKATNIPWLPEIPEHWEQESLRKFLKIVSIKNKPDKQLLSVTREQGVIIRDVDSKQENHNYIPVDLSGYKYVEVGDFCINKMKSWQGSYGVSDYEGIVSPAYYICKLSGVYKPFFNHAIRSKYYVAFFAQYSKGIRVDQWDLSPIGLKSIPFFLPPLSEQQAIVAHINSKVSKIETLTQKLQQEIEAIKEYKQRLISDVVTGQIKI